jgi:NADH:ubiquinone oxidoreductase subunit
MLQNIAGNTSALGGFHASVPWTLKPWDGIKLPPCPQRFNARSAMKTFLVRFFTWWNSQTFGTQLWTKRYGEFVGEDEFGNRYYRTKNGRIDPALGINRRWVIYNGVAEASMVPPSWHGWLHHTVNVLPTEDKIVPRPWEKPHRPNLTGTPGAYRPCGSTLAQGRRPKATGDYKAWTPGNQ